MREKSSGGKGIETRRGEVGEGRDATAAAEAGDEDGEVRRCAVQSSCAMDLGLLFSTYRTECRRLRRLG